MKRMRKIRVPDRWVLHSYYTLCPYAPDSSGRLLAAGADPESGQGEVFVLDAEGGLLDRFGKQPVTPSFWHTGFWQSWGPDARTVYYQGGPLHAPRAVRRELESGVETVVDADLEGIPPSGEPGISCSHALLYAAGYGDGQYKPEQAPVPFRARDRHGISEIGFDPPRERLVLSTQQILDEHPERNRILAAERDLQARIGRGEGLTLMTYCVRWNRQGTRFLFYFGNHCVDRRRGEPRVAYVFTADRSLRNPRLVLDLGFGRSGVHWGWQPDGETLIGYGPRPDGGPGRCLAEVRYDGTNYRKISDHAGGGHPSVSPADPDLIVTDEGTVDGGAVVFLSRRHGGREVARVALPKFIGPAEPKGRNSQRICHHPVFHPAGDRVLANSLPGRLAELVEFSPPAQEAEA